MSGVKGGVGTPTVAVLAILADVGAALATNDGLAINVAAEFHATRLVEDNKT